MKTTTDRDTLLTQTEAAPLVGVAPRTLERKRWAGDGPPFIRVSNRAVRYRRGDIEDWIAARRRTSTSDGNVASRLRQSNPFK